MSRERWTCRPTPRRKPLRRMVAERRKQQVKQWDWLQKQATALFVVYAEPDRQKEEEVTDERQG